MTNSTDINQLWWVNPDWLTAIGTLAAVIVAMVIAILSYNSTRKSEQSRSLTEVFRLLDDNAHRNARRRIVNLYGEKDIRRIIDIIGSKSTVQ